MYRYLLDQANMLVKGICFQVPSGGVIDDQSQRAFKNDESDDATLIPPGKTQKIDTADVASIISPKLYFHPTSFSRPTTHS